MQDSELRNLSMVLCHVSLALSMRLRLVLASVTGPPSARDLKIASGGPVQTRQIIGNGN